MQPDNPLWLPEGSVRAIIALVSVIAIIGFFISIGGDVAIAALSVTLGSVVTFYFTKKDKPSGSNEG